MSFVHLQVKSGYTLLQSTVKIKELVQKAKEDGQKAIALTDHNVMHAILPFYKECKKEGIKPILGITLTVQVEEKIYDLILLARNNQGYQHLLKLATAVQINEKEGVSLETLRAYSEHLFALFPYSQLQGAFFNKEHVKNILSPFSSLFRHHFYIAVTEKEASEETINMFRSCGIKAVGTNDVRYLEKEHQLAYQCLEAVRKGVKREEIEIHEQERYLKKEEEMKEAFAHFPSLLEETVHIANNCSVSLSLGSSFLPKYPVEEGKSAHVLLRKLCERGMDQKGLSEDKRYQHRLQYELNVIEKMSFSDYFLIVADFMHFAHRKGIITGPGRGSAAGSLVAYALDITTVDPIQYDLLFERFLNPERISMPDIDIDFPDHRRDEVIQYVMKRYGKEHVAQIITFGTLAAKAALRDIAKVFGVDGAEINKLSKLIPAKQGVTLKEVYNTSEEFRSILQSSSLLQTVFSVALLVEGLPRHSSIHAAGIVISEQPLTHYVPLQEGHGDVPLTQYAMNETAAAGLLKIDFLGLRNLTILERILKSVQKFNRTLTLQTIPLNDSETFRLLSNGDTAGIFQFESSGITEVLKTLKPSEFEDLVAVNALYRPGPMEQIPHYIKRKHGKEEVHYFHKDLKPILEKTYGVIVYQEQIMQIASRLAGFTLGEADLLRRAVSKKNRSALEEERQHFIKGCLQKGYSIEVASNLYQLIVQFANYGFNRSHAVAYSLIAYYLAYFKAHYKAHFTAALLTSAIGNEERVKQYVHEAKLKGLEILPPSINKSVYPFTVEGESAIRYSLAPIKYIGQTALREIIEKRKEKRFASLFDFCMRISEQAVGRNGLISLIYAGGFDEFGEDRATLIKSIDVAFEHASLMEDFGFEPKYAKAEPLTEEEKLGYEKQALGLYLSSHPLSSYRPFLQKEGAQPLFTLGQQKKGNVKVGALVTERREILTKRGERMAFLNLQDETGEIEGIVFPNAFRKFQEKLSIDGKIFIVGKIEERNHKFQLLINEVISLEDMKQSFLRALYLRVDSQQKQEEVFIELEETFKRFKGDTAVMIYYAAEDKTIRLAPSFNVNPSNECLQYLKKILGDGNVILRE
jgi:DNA polymerase III subunit alpha